MNSSFEVFGLTTGIIRSGDPIAERVLAAAERTCGGFEEGDILVLAETAVATSEGNVIDLSSVTPSPRAEELGEKYRIDPRTAEVVLQESDSIVGGIPGFLLCMKGGTLLPNAGVDASNAPPGCVTPLPADPDQSAVGVRAAIESRAGVRIGVIIADSRTHAMRSRVQRSCHRFGRYPLGHRRPREKRPLRAQTGSHETGGCRQYRIRRRAGDGRGRRMHACGDHPRHRPSRWGPCRRRDDRCHRVPLYGGICEGPHAVVIFPAGNTAHPQEVSGEKVKLEQTR